MIEHGYMKMPNGFANVPILIKQKEDAAEVPKFFGLYQTHYRKDGFQPRIVMSPESAIDRFNLVSFDTEFSNPAKKLH